MRPAPTKDPNVVVLAFHMKGCGACEEYLPRLRKIARTPRPELGGLAYSDYIPIYEIDANQREDLSNKYLIQYTPTTIILRRPTGMIRRDSALTDAEIEHLLGVALRGS